MSEDRVTIDKIMKMLWEVSGFRADATQTDALQVLLETYVAQQSIAYGDAPTQLIESLLNSLTHQASQLLDSGGRMRLTAEGQLDAKDQPLALAADVKVVDRRIDQLKSAISEMLTAQLAMTEKQAESDKKNARRQESFNAIVDMIGDDLRKLREERIAARAADEALTKTVLEATSWRGQWMEELSDQVQRMREVLSDAMMSPRPQPEAPGPMTPHRLSEDELAGWLGQPDLVPWERELIERELAERLTATTEAMSPKFDKTLPQEDIARLKADAAAGKIPKRKLKVKGKKKGSEEKPRSPMARVQPVFPGCFFNEDGTITCAICGVAKMPSQDPKISAYYKDRQAATGYKSACKDCEKAAKAEKAAAGL